MARLQECREGTQLEVKGRLIDFSLYPTVKKNRRYGLQSKLFASNPWGVINQAINERCDAAAKSQAISFLEQAEDFYRCSLTSSIVAAKPLLIYYCFLNLAKAFVLTKGHRSSYGAAFHGLQETVPPNGREFYDSFLIAHKSTRVDRPNIFDDFLASLTGFALSSNHQRFELKHLAAQLLQGHRIWADSANRKERFIEIHKPKFMHNDSTKEVWLEFELFSDDLSRFDISRKKLLNESRLANDFKEVDSNLSLGDRRILRFEQQNTITYTGRASDVLKDLTDTVRFKVWTTILKTPPYRKYYLYLSPQAEVNDVLPQILSIWCYFYYLGSVTRYRPNYFDEILDGRFGGHLQEIVSNLPQQFIYYMASEFSQREIAHAPIV